MSEDRNRLPDAGNQPTLNVSNLRPPAL